MHGPRPQPTRSPASFTRVAEQERSAGGISRLTRAAVLAAVAEADRLGRTAFLAKYGYRRSLVYELVVGDRRYDSKAICGAAHQYIDDGVRPLGPHEFSGGEATVVQVLRRLGFEVQVLRGRSEGWAEEERILALDLYLRRGTPGRNDAEVLALSAALAEGAFHPDAGTRANFRNPNGVAMKLANFAALDPAVDGRGLTSFSAGDLATWNEYAGDTDKLADAVAAIRSSLGSGASDDLAASAFTAELERVHVDQYDFTFTAGNGVITVDRSEGALVHRFAAWLRDSGRVVNARQYDVGRTVLRNDLADFTERRLWEAKSAVSRSAVRMAIGQLADYRRLELSATGGPWAGGVLLPRAPSRDLLHLIHSVGAAGAWATTPETFHVVHAA